MKRDERPDTLEYKGHTAEVIQPGWYCCECEEVVLTDADAAATDQAFIDLKAHAEGLLAGDQIRQVRKRLKLSQRMAGEILGGGPQAFQKYESRKTLASHAMSNLLRLLNKHPEMLDDLKTAP